ncbi:hypothetical protein LTR94_036215, partial [Friedmanniomyces endolithicus]
PRGAGVIMDFRKLHGQHQAIIRLASDLVGLVGKIRTREDATEARTLLERLDRPADDGWRGAVSAA